MRRAALLLLGLLASGARAQGLPDAFPALPTFTEPIDLVAAPSGDGLWVAERAGRVWAFDETPEADSRRLVLDLRDRVGPLASEGGMQSLAIHPSGTFVVVYYVTTENDTSEGVITRYPILADGAADLGSEREILRFAQPTVAHNGGKVLWGPDGMLYVPLGDGGLDPALSPNGQDRTTLLGSVLRIQVPLAEEDGYSIPPDNPFVGNTEGWREEIWAWGVRNPWRSAFDASGRLWLADVGQNTWEEVNIVERGGNYGWDHAEGPICSTPPCNGFVAPVFHYLHDSASGGFSITGGTVYQGTRAPGLVGRYVFGDFITHRFWSLDPDEPTDVIDHGTIPGTPWIVDFGESASGELYALAYFPGRVLDIGAWVATRAEAIPAAGPLALTIAPNPARGGATVSWTSNASGLAHVAVTDALGRTVLNYAPLARAGRQKLDVSALAAGLYAVRVETPEAGCDAAADGDR